MDPTLQSVVRFFEADDIRHHVDEEGGSVSCSLAGRHGTLDVWVECNAGPNLFKVFVYAPVPVPEARRAEATAFCNRVNWAIGPGALEMNPEDGRVRYRCSTWTDGAPPPDDALGYLVRGSFATLDGMLPALMAVSWGNVAAADAYRMAMEEESA